jgi:hypothetical protein
MNIQKDSLVKILPKVKQKKIDTHNDQWVRELKENGYGYSDIAKMIGCSWHYVYFFFNPDKKVTSTKKRVNNPKKNADAQKRFREKIKAESQALKKSDYKVKLSNKNFVQLNKKRRIVRKNIFLEFKKAILDHPDTYIHKEDVIYEINKVLIMIRNKKDFQ